MAAAAAAAGQEQSAFVQWQRRGRGRRTSATPHDAHCGPPSRAASPPPLLLTRGPSAPLPSTHGAAAQAHEERWRTRPRRNRSRVAAGPLRRAPGRLAVPAAAATDGRTDRRALAHSPRLLPCNPGCEDKAERVGRTAPPPGWSEGAEPRRARTQAPPPQPGEKDVAVEVEAGSGAWCRLRGVLSRGGGERSVLRLRVRSLYPLESAYGDIALTKAICVLQSLRILKDGTVRHMQIDKQPSRIRRVKEKGNNTSPLLILLHPEKMFYS